MKLSPKMRLKKSWRNLEKKVGEVKKKVTGKANSTIELWTGRWIHKQIASLFIFDEHVQGWVFGGKVCPHCKRKNRDKFDKCKNCGAELEGGKDFKGIIEYDDARNEKAVRESTMLKSYIMMKSNQDRKYKTKLDGIAEKLESKQDEFEKKLKKMKGSKFLKWIKKDVE